MIVRPANMIPKLEIIISAITLPVLVSCSSLHAEKENPAGQFPSVGERRIKVIGDRIEQVGCVLNKEAILAAKDGEAVLFKHKTDPRGDVTVVFNHRILPKGNWVLYGAKNSLEGSENEKAPAKPPNRMEAVSAVLSGRALNYQPRDLDISEHYRSVYVDVSRIWGWDVKLAHSWESTSSVHSFDYSVPAKSEEGEKTFQNHQIPIVYIIHRDERGNFLGGALLWFENKD
jgi:hypothetical protein